MEIEQYDEDVKKMKAFVDEILAMCEDKGFTVSEVIYLPNWLKNAINRQVNKNNSKNRFVKY
ncbi:MAG: hypothetical protein ACLRT4_18255 [Thomasclavelia sp.]